MWSDQILCPYAGLRPFTEDESIYFKGRDAHIDQATRQLEQNKFIIVTGASGDGKSSLVYAGIVPNAKAGFLKAAYSNWIVADFRPERKPMQNLSRSLARALELSESTVETNLRYGFSALVDMYKASSYYADPAQRNDLAGKRQSANLIILADQFEEFFTNPENFHDGIPSQDAVSVTNILLETARLALTEQLPIYVILTMRSDYIGQCAAFRGLPGYIGFSQFFLPRLNRKELREVIEEPAVLNGNSISRRLTERLIYDIEDGADQLPILQHALNQIWKTADNGTVEMDLVHYAMVGGMSASELQPEKAGEFQSWFRTLPQKVQACYHTPNLKNVLNTHANKLYELAWDRLSETDRKHFSDHQVQRIIAATFKCLTRIDNGRAVRNRMTLLEICSIIDMPDVTPTVVAMSIQLFREPGNTLLRPFSDTGEALRSDDVLDITHESLIRNWEKLNEWATEEFASYTISRDFVTQLDRWIDHDRSPNFLLSIGGLTYFENWLVTQKFNAAWIARYLKGDDHSQRREKAVSIETNAKQFVQASARRHRLTRTLLRYSNRKTGIVLGLVVLLTLTSFVAKNYFARQNEYVLRKLGSEVATYVDKQNVSAIARSELAIEALRLNQVTLPELVAAVSDPVERMEFAVATTTVLAYQGRGKPADVLMQSVHVTDSLLEAYPKEDTNPVHLAQRLKHINDFADALEIAFVYLPSAALDATRQNNAKRGGQAALQVLRVKPAGYTDAGVINTNLERAVTYRTFTTDELREVLDLLSPFEKEQTPWMATLYNANRTIRDGFYGGFTHNGLYQQLAYLYAAVGNAGDVLRCVDTLLLYKEPYFQFSYASNADNASHIAAAFFRSQQLSGLDEFVKGYCTRMGITSENFYGLLVARCKMYEFSTVITPMLPNYDLRINTSLEFSDSSQLKFFFSKYRAAAAATIKSTDALNFQLALSYKDQAILNIRRLEVSSQGDQASRYYALFDKAMHYYSLVSPAYLDQMIETVELSHFNKLTVKRKFLFIYPDVRTQFHPNEPRLFHFFYTSQAFLRYMLERDAFDKLYSDPSDYLYLTNFIRDYHYVETDLLYTLSEAIDFKVLVALEKKIAAGGPPTTPNFSLLYLYLGREAARHHDEKSSLEYFHHLSPEGVRANMANSFDARIPFRLLATAIADMAQQGDFASIDKIVNSFEIPENRISLYSYASQELSLRRAAPGSDTLLAAAKRDLLKAKSLDNARINCRSLLAYAELLRESPPDAAAAYRLIKNIEVKYPGIYLIGEGLAFRGKLYEAYNNIPMDMSDLEIIRLFTGVYRGYNASLNVSTTPWLGYRESHQTASDRPIFYVPEHN
jgi:hypothetical protein